MPPYRRSAAFIGLAVCLSISVTSCANSPTGKALEQSLAADPKLEDNPVTFGSSPTAIAGPSDTVAKLPDDFPSEIPRYPNAELQEVKPLTGERGDRGHLTRWTVSDSSDRVSNFYRQQFQNKNWLLQSPLASDPPDTIAASRDKLQVKVSVKPSDAPNSTALIIKYLRESEAIATPQPDSSKTAEVQPQPEPTSSASPTPSLSSGTPAPSAGLGSFADLNKVPSELRQYVEDIAALEVLTPNTASDKNKQSTTAVAFAPNKTITRREYARWLVAVNNQIHANQPGRKIRTGVESAKPIFQDVSVKDPDFAAIQGLAEAGIVPSPLFVEGTDVQFRPDAQLTREVLVLWKVPLDTRRSLPTASVEALQQTWGFQDAAKIDPKALRAVLADFQNGDLANIRRCFGYTTLFQPKKSVTRAEAAAALWYFGSQGEGLSAKDVLAAKSQAN